MTHSKDCNTSQSSLNSEKAFQKVVSMDMNKAFFLKKKIVIQNGVLLMLKIRF